MSHMTDRTTGSSYMGAPAKQMTVKMQNFDYNRGY
jgi:hypothetical protein